MSYKELFTKYQILRQLSLVQLVVYFGAWFSNVAIYTLLVKLEASAIMISLVVSMHFIPAVILAPFSGAFVDRIHPKKLMMSLMFIELFMTLGFLTIKSLDDIWLLMLLLFIRMGSASMFFTAEMSLLPKIISGTALQKANEIHSMIWSFTFTAGMALGGVVVYTFGTDGIF